MNATAQILPYLLYVGSISMPTHSPAVSNPASVSYTHLHRTEYEAENHHANENTKKDLQKPRQKFRESSGRRKAAAEDAEELR